MQAIRKNSESGMVTLHDGVAVTTSLKIAEVFGKQHKHVLETIRNLECSEDFRRTNFRPSSYLNDQNKGQPMFHVTRDGFTMLAMGFTGKKAMEFKESYIAAFNAMEKNLKSPMRETVREIVSATMEAQSESIRKVLQENMRLRIQNNMLTAFVPSCGLENIGKSGKHKFRRGAEVKDTGTGRPIHIITNIMMQLELPLGECSRMLEM